MGAAHHIELKVRRKTRAAISSSLNLSSFCALDLQLQSDRRAEIWWRIAGRAFTRRADRREERSESAPRRTCIRAFGCVISMTLEKCACSPPDEMRPFPDLCLIAFGKAIDWPLGRRVEAAFAHLISIREASWMT